MNSLIDSGQLVASLGIVVAIVAILMPVAIVWIVLHFKHRRALEKLEIARHLAEKGLPVPVELLHDAADVPAAPNPGAELKAALSTLGAGVGLMVFFYVTVFLRFLWGVGALVAIVGLAQLLAYWISQRQSARADAQRLGG
jgi:hypothetical protein